MDRINKDTPLTAEDIKQFLDAAPAVIRKAFDIVFQKRKEIQEKREQLREEIKRGTRKGKTEPI